MPGTFESSAVAFSISPPGCVLARPLWGSATTTSAPASRISGTSARAVSTMPRTLTRPSRWSLSHCMICGGVKPMTPTAIACDRPSVSRISRSSSTQGRK